MRHASSANAAILVALHVSVNVMKAKKFLEYDFILTRIKDEDIARSRARNLVYKFLIRFFCEPLGKGVQEELRHDCHLKGGVRSLLKNKHPNKECTV